jgi:hypothetical protein
MSKTPLSNSFISEKDQNTSPKKTKSQFKENGQRKKIIRDSSKKFGDEEILQSKYCYKTPYNSKNEEFDYSKMEMPVSYQLTNGKCIRLRNSQYSKSLYECENEKLNLYEQSRNIANNNYKDMELNLNVESKSSDYANNIDSAMITIKNGKINVDESKSKNSLWNYGKSNYIYPMKFIKHHKKKINRELSQGTKHGSQSERKTYKKFDLMVNPSYKYNKKFIASPIHKFLPYCKKDDEIYKKKLINYIRTEAPNLIGGAKSTGGIFAKYIKHNEIEKNKGDDNSFYILKKKKKIYSTKKVFAAEKNLYNYCLIDGKNKVDYEHPKKFRFFFDNDIGFNYSWQSPLIVANGDDDVETDDEVLNMAEEKCMDDLVEGINAWNKSSRLCRNYTLVKKLNRLVNTPSFNSIIKNKKNRNNVKGNENKKENSIKDLNNSIDFIASFGK